MDITGKAVYFKTLRFVSIIIIIKYYVNIIVINLIN